MSSQPHDTNIHAAWETEIVPRLPADLETQARALKAWQRPRKLTCPTDLLHGLLAYAGTVTSFRMLSCWGVVSHLADLAPSSWCERLQHSAAWLQWLASTLLTIPQVTWLPQQVRGRVLLIDATMLRWLGGTGDDLRLHLAVDLLAGQLAQVVLTDQHGGEHVRHFTLQVGDLAVLDGGYGYRDRLATIQQAGADGVLRIYPSTFPLETVQGQRLDLRAWLDQPGRDQRSRLAYYWHAGQRYAVRVLAQRRSAAQQVGARRHAAARARKYQRALSEPAQYFADWMILVTSLLDETVWPAPSIWRLYTARWQVELLIKRMKQFLGMGRLPSATPTSAIPLVWAMLVLWALHEPLGQDVRQTLQDLAAPAPTTLPGQVPSDDAVVSTWMVSALLLDGLRQAIRGNWGIRQILACLPQLRRGLISHPRRDRVHQQTTVVAWLSGITRTRRRPLLDAV